MKLVNYKRGYNNLFDCSIHGTIYMTDDEWQTALKYISDKQGELDLYGGSTMWSIFVRDTQRKYSDKKHSYLNIRITATKMLADHFNLTNYKKGNYQIAVSKAV